MTCDDTSLVLIKIIVFERNELITESAVSQVWWIETKKSLITLTWLPFVFIQNNGKTVFSEIPEGFESIEIPPGSKILGKKRSYSEKSDRRLDEIYPFSCEFTKGMDLGGMLFLPKDYHAWLDLILTQQTHPFIQSLKKWYFSDRNQHWYFRDKELDLKSHHVMGIWNITPDSFSSGCEKIQASGIEFVKQLLNEEPDVLDVGGESTRPGAHPITADEEIQRLEQSLNWVRNDSEIPISLDSRHFKTIRYFLEENKIDIVNDIGMPSEDDQEHLKIYAEAGHYDAGLIIMAYESHENNELSYSSCVEKIVKQLWERLNTAYHNGVDMRTVLVDPGIGFGKGLENDFRLIFDAPLALMCLGRPVLIAHSRKRCLARMLNLPKNHLDVPTAITAAMAVFKGAAMVRVHHVAETKAALKTFDASLPMMGV